MSLPVSAIYVAALGIIALVLQFHVGRTRSRLRIALGDGGNPEMLEAMRRQANFVENAPIALLLLVVIELNGGSATTLHALGATLVVSRIIHPFGIYSNRMTLARGLGAGLTSLVLLAEIVIIARQLF